MGGSERNGKVGSNTTQHLVDSAPVSKFAAVGAGNGSEHQHSEFSPGRSFLIRHQSRKSPGAQLIICSQVCIALVFVLVLLELPTQMHGWAMTIARHL